MKDLTGCLLLFRKVKVYGVFSLLEGNLSTDNCPDLQNIQERNIGKQEEEDKKLQKNLEQLYLTHAPGPGEEEKQT